MGQRTAILIKKNYRVDGRDVSEISLIHHQWGLGKVMPMLFMGQLIELNYSCNRRKNYDFKTAPITREFTFEPLSNDYPYIDKELHYADDDDFVDVWDKDTRIKLFEKTDNNNGGMIIEYTQFYDDRGEPKTYDDYYKIKVGFVLGYEETKKPFEKLVSAKQYINKTWNYKEARKTNTLCYKAFKSLCEIFDIEEVYDKKEKK